MFELVYRTQWPEGAQNFRSVDLETHERFAEWRRAQPGFVFFHAENPDSTSLEGHHWFDSEESCAAFEAAMQNHPDRVAQLQYEQSVGITRTVVYRGPI